jgi:hypothetical protein
MFQSFVRINIFSHGLARKKQKNNKTKQNLRLFKKKEFKKNYSAATI